MTINTSRVKEKYEVKGAITALLNRLAALPALPGEASSKSPALLYKNDNLKPATESDAMLGMVLTEHFLGGAFNFAANDNGTASDTNGLQSAICMIGPDDLAEFYSDFLQDREADNGKRGKGTYALDGSRAICAAFNKDANKTSTEAVKISPARMAIEQNLAQLLRELEYLSASESIAPPEPIAA